MSSPQMDAPNPGSGDAFPDSVPSFVAPEMGPVVLPNLAPLPSLAALPDLTPPSPDPAPTPAVTPVPPASAWVPPASAWTPPGAWASPSQYQPASPWQQPAMYGMPPAQFGGPSGVWPHAAASGAKNSLGIWALVFGLAPIVLLIIIGSADLTSASSGVGAFLVFAWFGVGILAIVFGVSSIRAAGRGEATNKGMGIAGLVFGIISDGLFVIAIIAAVLMYVMTGS